MAMARRQNPLREVLALALVLTVQPSLDKRQILALARALAERRLDEKIKLYTVPRFLIIDEIGSLPIDETGAKLFLQLISRRYE